MAAQSSNVWLEYFMNYDPQINLSKITVPVMAVNGSNDVQVLPDSNLGAIRKYLSGKNKKTLSRNIPD